MRPTISPVAASSASGESAAWNSGPVNREPHLRRGRGDAPVVAERLVLRQAHRLVEVGAVGDDLEPLRHYRRRQAVAVQAAGHPADVAHGLESVLREQRRGRVI